MRTYELKEHQYPGLINGSLIYLFAGPDKPFNYEGMMMTQQDELELLELVYSDASDDELRERINKVERVKHYRKYHRECKRIKRNRHLVAHPNLGLPEYTGGGQEEIDRIYSMIPPELEFGSPFEPNLAYFRQEFKEDHLRKRNLPPSLNKRQMFASLAHEFGFAGLVIWAVIRAMYLLPTGVPYFSLSLFFGGLALAPIQTFKTYKDEDVPFWVILQIAVFTPLLCFALLMPPDGKALLQDIGYLGVLMLIFLGAIVFFIGGWAIFLAWGGVYLRTTLLNDYLKAKKNNAIFRRERNK